MAYTIEQFIQSMHSCDSKPPKSNFQKRSVVGIVFSKDKKKILLLKRRDVPVWALPGGGVDQGETPEEAVIREIKEETGLVATVSRPVAIYTPLNRLANDTYTFECAFSSGTLSTGSETKAIDFFALDKLPSPFFFLHKDWLDDACRNELTLIKRALTEVTYYNLFKYFLRHPLQVLRMGLSRYVIPYNSK